MNAVRAAFPLVILAAAALSGCRPGGQQPEPARPLQWVPMPSIAGSEDPSLRAALLEAARVMEFEDWPGSRVLRTAPEFGDIRALLFPSAHSSIRENTTYEAVSFNDGLWGQVRWKCVFWPGRLSPECVEVRLVLCPSCLAAKELLLLDAAVADVPVPVTVSLYFQRIKKIGNVAFGRLEDGYGEIRFVRDNVFVHISTRGGLAEETASLARRIDGLIRKRPRRSYRGLIRRRPTIQIAPTDEPGPSAQRAACCRISAPGGRKIVSCNACVNGLDASVGKDGRVDLGATAVPKWVNLTAVTDELLVGRCERLVVPAGSPQAAAPDKE